MKNTQLQSTIKELKKASIENEAGIWKRIAEDLERPTRIKRVVNVYSIDKNSKDGEVVIVPGKVLGTGELSKKVTVAAYSFSDGAFDKIKAKGECVTILDLVKKNPKGKNVRILG